MQAFKIDLIVYLGLHFLSSFHVLFVCVCLSVQLLVLLCRDLFCRSCVLSLIVQSSQSKVTFFFVFFLDQISLVNVNSV